MTENTSCRICKTPSAIFLEEKRTFYKCPVCSLIFTNETASQEEAEKHYKGQWTPGKDAFWSKQCTEILNILNQYGLNKENRILDFGAGSGEITRGLQQRGYNVTPLEPMMDGYLKDQNYQEPFDVIIAVEVIEHLLNPYDEFREMEKVLSERGILFFTTLMTNPMMGQPNEKEIFSSWWYKNDPTHVSFFCNNALFKMAEILKCEVNIFGDQVFTLYR